MLISIVIAAVYGLIFGSFANAVAYRVPTGETLWSRSHCPKCEAQIHWWQNIPVLSWLALRGKCANCKNPISFQYPAIELLTSALFAVLTWSVIDKGLVEDYTSITSLIGVLLVIVALCYFAFIGVVLSIIDLKTQRLPDVLVLPTFAVSLVLLSVAALLIDEPSRILTMFICAVGSSFLYGILWFFFPNGFGLGDVKLMLVVGAILGWFSVGQAVLGVMLPFIVLSVVALPLMLVKIVGRKTKAPLGPWIVLGAIISIMFGDIIVNTYLSVGGFQ